MSTYRLGVDIGGTFTDIVFLADDGSVITRKVSSTVDDYARAIVEGVGAVLAETGILGDDIAEVLHGTTVASNAILELKGARAGLITTAGFRDVLEIRNLRMPRLYDLTWTKPPVLIERRLRVTVEERIDAGGHVQVPLSRADAEAAVDRLLAEGVEAIAVCLVHSYANPAHEKMIQEIVREKAPDLPLCISFDVLPEIKEYERTSTTVINTYVLPIVARYLEVLRADLDAAGITAQLLLMQSNGGLIPDATARVKPMNIIESGPAGGVVGAQAVARRSGIPNVITFDMGGTTAKASMIENGSFTRALDYQVGGGIMMGSRLLTGSGYLLKVPAIDLAEVGAGGGSIVWIDAGGALQIGPESAGAVPGPLCYDIGGTDPTVTDANVLLGYLNPEYLVSGALRLNVERAREIFDATIATPLKMSVADAAFGAHRIAASNMIRAIRSVSMERGRDPRDYTLFAFGGNGAVFAAGMARELRMNKVLVPPSAGVFSSFGLLYADVEHHYSRTLRGRIREIDVGVVSQAWDAIVAEAGAQLATDGFTGKQASIERFAGLHYEGQTFELTIPLPDGPIDFTVLEHAFGDEHERTYGHRAGPDEPVELVNIQVVARGLPDRPRVPDRIGIASAPTAERPRPRKAYFGPEIGWCDVPVLFRADLVEPHAGPCIVEEYDTTCVVPPDATAVLDAFGNIAITLN